LLYYIINTFLLDPSNTHAQSELDHLSELEKSFADKTELIKAKINEFVLYKETYKYMNSNTFKVELDLNYIDLSGKQVMKKIYLYFT